MASCMYVALVPPAEILESIDDLVARMRGRRPPEDPRGLRWIRPGDAHLTLAFMASVEDPDAVAEGLAADLARAAPVAVGLSGAGAFPEPVSARVLWLAVDDPAGALPELARSTRSSVHRAGGRPEGGGFSPHLTLARCRRGDVTSEIDALSGFRTPMWVARSVVLFESHLGDRGARHQAVAEIPLAEAAQDRGGLSRGRRSSGPPR